MYIFQKCRSERPGDAFLYFSDDTSLSNYVVNNFCIIVTIPISIVFSEYGV